jgi:hypothetical protein
MSVPDGRYVAHMDATHIGIKRKGPAQGTVFLLLRSKRADEVLVVHGRDDECAIHESGLLDDPIDLRLSGEMRYVEFAAADRLHIWQRRPDQVFDTSILGSVHRRCGLLEFMLWRGVAPD